MPLLAPSCKYMLHPYCVVSVAVIYRRCARLLHPSMLGRGAEGVAEIMELHFQTIKAAKVAARHRVQEFGRDAAIMRCDQSAPGPFCVVTAEYARSNELLLEYLVEFVCAPARLDPATNWPMR